MVVQLTRDGHSPPRDWQKQEWSSADRPRSRPEWALRSGRFVVDEDIWRTVSTNDVGEVASPARKKLKIYNKKASSAPEQPASAASPTGEGTKAAGDSEHVRCLLVKMLFIKMQYIYAYKYIYVSIVAQARHVARRIRSNLRTSRSQVSEHRRPDAVRALQQVHKSRILTEMFRCRRWMMCAPTGIRCMSDCRLYRRLWCHGTTAHCPC